MKSELFQLVSALIVLSVGGAAEELLPKWGGAGVPLLLALVLVRVRHLPPVLALSFAGMAGAAEDALSSLPFATGTSFFVLAAIWTRRVSVPEWASVVVAYGLFQLWLFLWGCVAGDVFVRLLASVPLSVLAVWTVCLVRRLLVPSRPAEEVSDDEE